MSIDEAKQYSLTNFQAKGQRKQAIKSDHNLLKAVFDINFKKAKPDYRRTLYNYKNEAGIKKFSGLTSHKGMFTKHFNNENTFLVQFKQWEKQLQKVIAMCFKKVRLSKKSKMLQKQRVHNLLDRRSKGIKKNEEEVLKLEGQI